jgi:hypothetical protein
MDILPEGEQLRRAIKWMYGDRFLPIVKFSNPSCMKITSLSKVKQSDHCCRYVLITQL